MFAGNGFAIPLFIVYTVKDVFEIIEKGSRLHVCFPLCFSDKILFLKLKFGG